jgi:formylmethanofuran--tetrahydromethanopterin N-formyltransferase
MTGFATSVLQVRRRSTQLGPDETPDARPGIAVLVFAIGTENLHRRLVERIGQTMLRARRRVASMDCRSARPRAAAVRARVRRQISDQ